ncbi:hypothetical protein AVEN_209079-1, partial [Araneus ventricosus]
MTKTTSEQAPSNPKVVRPVRSGSKYGDKKK